METDSPSVPHSSHDLIMERLVSVGVPENYCSNHGLVEFVRANPARISELVSVILPTDEDVKLGLAQSRERSRKSAVSPTVKKRFRESMDMLQWLMFLDEPDASLRNLAKLNLDQRGVCGSVWGHNDIAYRCRTCENDPTCAICVPCFLNGNHDSHDYSIIYTGGGCCDCGDETAWKPGGFCSKHKGSEQIQPLAENLANSVGPVLDALFACWNNKLLSAESIGHKGARSNDSLVVPQKMSNELTFIVVEMLLEFSKSSESLLSFVSRRIISSSGLLSILLKAERFLDQDVMKKLHDLFLKLIGDPVFKCEFAKAFVSYYPFVISEAVKQGTDNAFKKYPLLSTFSVQVFTVPTLTPFLVKEMNLLAMLLGCLSDIFVSCSGEDGGLQATKLDRLSDTSERVIGDLKFVTSHAIVSKYATHEHRELSRSWLRLLTFAQGMNPLKRETGIPVEDENDNMHLFFVLDHSTAVIHSLLVNGTYSAASDGEIENERTAKEELDKGEGDGKRYAKVGRLSHEDSVCTAMVSSSSFDSSMASEVHRTDPFHARLPSSAICLIRECLKVLDTCLGNDEGISKFLCKFSSPSGRSIPGSKMSWPSRDMLKVETGVGVSSNLASSSRDSSTGLSPLCGEIQTNLSLDNVGGPNGVVQTDITADSRGVSYNSADLTKNASGVHILGLCDWPDISYDVSSQAISVHLPLHRLLSLLIERALRICYGVSASHNKVGNSHEILHADFFSSVIGDFHPSGFSSLVMEHVLRVRVFCSQVIAGMWKKNGDSALVSCEWYRSVRWSEQGLELDLFLLQCCGALAPADSYVDKLLSRFGLSSYLSLNPDITNEYEPVLVQEMLALLIQILQERRFCGLSTSESLRREIIFKLATGDFTHSQLVKSLPRDLSKSDELQEVLDDVSVYCNPSGMNQGKYSLRPSCWKELDLYHPRWYSRELQSAEERFSRYSGVSALTTQLPRWKMIYPPLKGLARIGTCKTTFQIISSALYYALESGISAKSRAPDGVLITALHLLSLSLDICTQQRQSNSQDCCVENSIPILELAGLEIIGTDQGTEKQSLLSLLVSLMRTRMGDGLHQFQEAGSCNISSWIGNLLKKFSAIDSVCMNLLQSLAPEVVGQSGFDKVMSGSASDEKRKAKAKERQAAIMAKMKAEQSKFLSTLSSSMDDDDTRSETETSDSGMEHDSIAVREVCSLCHDPDSKDPVSFLIFLQKSKLLSFVDRGPPSWDQGPQSEKQISVDGVPDLLRMNASSDSFRISSPHALQLSGDATSESATDSVLESIKARLIGNGQTEKRSSDGRGKDESNRESLEIAMYQTVRKKIEDMINQSLTRVDHRHHEVENSSEKNSVGGPSTLQVRFPEIRSRKTPRRPDAGSDGFHPTDCDGVYFSSCGHAVHQSCLERYLKSLKERSGRRNVFEGAHIVDLDLGEFLCPACRRLANSVLPACPGDLCSVSKLQDSPPTRLGRLDAQKPSLRFSEALCLLRTAAEVIEDGDSGKTGSLQGDGPRRKDLDSISNKLWDFYYSKQQEKPSETPWLPQSIYMWDTLKYSLISMEIVTRCAKNSLLPVYSIDSLYEEFRTSTGTVLSVLLRVVQSTRTKNAIHVRQRFMGMKHLAESICSGISSSSSSSIFGSEGTTGSLKNINLLWNRASDPVLAHDPFSSLMWALFCLPSPFLTCEESLLSLVHIFHSVSLVQTVIAYCSCRLSDLSELNFEEKLLNDISNALRESGGWEYFMSNNMDLSCDIKDTIRKYSLPFLRRCALLWKLLKSTPGKLHEDADMFDLPSDSAGDNMDFMYGPQSELNHVLELEKMFKIPPVDTILNDERLRSSTQTWLKHFQREYKINRVQRPLYITPVVSFQLMKLPNLYQELLQRCIKKSCSNCNKVIEEPALCLLCGRLCSPIWRPCCRESGCQTHAITCGAGTGVYLLIRRTTILLQRFARQSPWPSPYLDSFGEEDLEMSRGRRLYLNEERYAALTYMVGSHGLDHSSKVLNQTTIGTFFV
ncbi:PREDICTED: E3 ubiquitin-protein ligase PRT6 isoform X2 [Camelina sativa]|uniref:E3 ubiquitin-protein ligase n=1 Tax=Camelina sativa TaxID=90675 RepID=A0ABM0V7C5_CAMSA|nr:PREDICTED: E3 ubiquitin-protein ligase PRT6 isoform X1 [Camelina sativa]XP_010452067.1 PREDICTED: E3 ubiquitin-protein ligase PRT6 isoform X1 [Camelina sativa]XP_010452068.1 PREDICTED: E3 ubiquitin-protein ligase PRT6 isoform X2 [Camelina sativa]